MVFRRADPRLCVPLTGLTGLLAWKAGFPGLCVYLVLLFLLFTTGGLGQRMESGAVRRTLRFAAFWAVLKLVFDAAGYFWAVWPELRDTVRTLGPPLGAEQLAAALLPLCREAALLFLRLLVLLFSALALTLHASPRALALAATWLLRPVAGKEAWKPGLALALMAQYLPRIHRIVGQTRLATRARGLPTKGPAYWRIALPQLFRLLAQTPWRQTLGIASRGLDRPEAWRVHEPLAPAALCAALAVAGLLIVLARL